MKVWSKVHITDKNKDVETISKSLTNYLYAYGPMSNIAKKYNMDRADVVRMNQYTVRPPHRPGQLRFPPRPATPSPAPRPSQPPAAAQSAPDPRRVSFASLGSPPLRAPPPGPSRSVAAGATRTARIPKRWEPEPASRSERWC